MSVVAIILLIFFSYAFAGVLAFIPYLVGIFSSFFIFFLDLLSYYVYPVGHVVYVVVSGLVIYTIIYFVYRMFVRH